MIAKQAVDPRPAGRRRHRGCGEKRPREQLERVDDIVGDRRISGDDGKRDRSRSGWPALSRRERDRGAVERVRSDPVNRRVEDLVVAGRVDITDRGDRLHRRHRQPHRSEEHTSEIQSLMRISYAVFCLKKKKSRNKYNYHPPSPSYKHIPTHSRSTQSTTNSPPNYPLTR